jgi:hypothetical protein
VVRVCDDPELRAVVEAKLGRRVGPTFRVEDIREVEMPREKRHARFAALDNVRWWVRFTSDEDGTYWPITRFEDLGVTRAQANDPAVDVPRCGNVDWKFNDCKAFAGRGTDHEGVGPCRKHNGGRSSVKAEVAWLVGHRFAREMDVSPWEGLLLAVRVAAGKLAYAQEKISEATSDLELEGRVTRGEALTPGGPPALYHPDTGELLGIGAFKDLSFWVAQADRWHDRLMRVSKMAIDSGVAEQLVRNQTLEVEMLARVVEAGLREAGLTESQEHAVRSAMRRELVIIEDEKLVMAAGPLAIVGSHDENPEEYL